MTLNFDPVGGVMSRLIQMRLLGHAQVLWRAALISELSGHTCQTHQVWSMADPSVSAESKTCTQTRKHLVDSGQVVSHWSTPNSTCSLLYNWLWNANGWKLVLDTELCDYPEWWHSNTVCYSFAENKIFDSLSINIRVFLPCDDERVGKGEGCDEVKSGSFMGTQLRSSQHSSPPAAKEGFVMVQAISVS